MTQYHFDPATYLELMAAEVPSYRCLQSEVAAAATVGPRACAILELGTGTGETARLVAPLHPGARLVGIDSSAPMLDRARTVLPEADLRVARLEDPLPQGPFDLVFSALTVHHLDASGKRDLFQRLGTVMTPGGRLVIGDVVVPDDPADALTPLSHKYDFPSPADDQLIWLRRVGFDAEVTWSERDLAVISARLGDRTSNRSR